MSRLSIIKLSINLLIFINEFARFIYFLPDLNEFLHKLPSHLRAFGGYLHRTFIRMEDQRSLPTGVLMEILTRLPVKTLVKFQLVCKDWRTLIHEDYFKEMHLDRSIVISHRWHNRVLTGNNPNPPNPNPDRDPAVYRHGCNGLVLLKKVNEKKHYVWNPAIRRCLVLPDPNESSKGFAFSYVPATKIYKIVSFYGAGNGSLACEIITPGGDSVWRALELPEIGNKESVVKREGVVGCRGAAHYVLVTEVIDIVSLDLETESFSVSRFPDFSGEWKNCWELDWDGKLGFAEVVGENLEVMVLEDYKSGRWCEEKRVVGLEFLNDSMVIPLYREKREICFWLKEEKIFKYNVETRQCTDFMRELSLCLSSKVHPHKPSLISLEGMVPDNPMFDKWR